MLRLGEILLLREKHTYLLSNTKNICTINPAQTQQDAVNNLYIIYVTYNIYMYI